MHNDACTMHQVNFVLLVKAHDHPTQYVLRLQLFMLSHAASTGKNLASLSLYPL